MAGWVTVASRFRTFSLRTLLVVVTVLCAFLACEMNWIHQRRQFIAEQKRQLNEYRHGLFSTDTFGARAPALLGWFGEHHYDSIALVVPFEDTAKSTVNLFGGNNHSWEEDVLWIFWHHPDYQRARRLFPEVQKDGFGVVWVFTQTKAQDQQPVMVKDAFGKISGAVEVKYLGRGSDINTGNGERKPVTDPFQ